MTPVHRINSRDPIRAVSSPQQAGPHRYLGSHRFLTSWALKVAFAEPLTVPSPRFLDSCILAEQRAAPSLAGPERISREHRLVFRVLFFLLNPFFALDYSLTFFNVNSVAPSTERTNTDCRVRKHRRLNSAQGSLPITNSPVYILRSRPFPSSLAVRPRRPRSTHTTTTLNHFLRPLD